MNILYIIAISIIILITGCSSTPSRLKNVTPLKKGVLYFDCDAFPGNLSESAYTSKHPITLVEGVLRLNETRKHKKWIPVISVGIRSRDEKTRMLLKFNFLQKDGKLTPSVYITSANGKKPESHNLSGEYEVGDKINFTISKMNDSFLKVHFSGQQAEYKIPFSEDGYIVSSSCSTGWGEISVKSIE